MSGWVEGSSDREASAAAFETVAAWNDELVGAETGRELLGAVLDIALEDRRLSTAAVYRFDRTAARLRPELARMESATAVSPGDGPVWEVFKNGTSVVSDTGDVAARDGTPARDDGTGGRRLAVPLGEDEVLTVEGLIDPDEVGDVVAALEALCATANATLRRIRCEEGLRERDAESKRRARTLERIERVRETYSAVTRAAVSADTRAELDATVCDRLVGDDAVEFAWIGELDRSDGAVTSRTWGGAERGYLEPTPVDLDDSSRPGVRALRDTEACAVDDVASGVGDERWRSEALERGFRSVVAVPLLDDGVRHGVLAAYGNRPNAFEGAAELAVDAGRVVGHAITRIQCQNGLLADFSTELDIEVTAPACFFVRFVRETETGVSFEAMSPAEDGSVGVFVRAEAPELLVEYADRALAVRSVERLESDTEGSVVRGRFGDSFVGSFLSRHGITLESVSATPKEVRIVVSIPPSMTPRQALGIVDAEYPGATLLAKRETRRRDDGPAASRPGLLELLTDRQREVAERAHREGYFETPKGATGKSIASSMDLSTSTFHNHLRGAESELFSWVFDDGSE